MITILKAKVLKPSAAYQRASRRSWGSSRIDDEPRADGKQRSERVVRSRARDRKERTGLVVDSGTRAVSFPDTSGREVFPSPKDGEVDVM
jgi:hypothetical protein